MTTPRPDINININLTPEQADILARLTAMLSPVDRAVFLLASAANDAFEKAVDPQAKALGLKAGDPYMVLFDPTKVSETGFTMDHMTVLPVPAAEQDGISLDTMRSALQVLNPAVNYLEHRSLGGEFSTWFDEEYRLRDGWLPCFMETDPINGEPCVIYGGPMLFTIKDDEKHPGEAVALRYYPNAITSKNEPGPYGAASLAILGVISSTFKTLAPSKREMVRDKMIQENDPLYDSTWRITSL